MKLALVFNFIGILILSYAAIDTPTLLYEFLTEFLVHFWLKLMEGLVIISLYNFSLEF